MTPIARWITLFTVVACLPANGVAGSARDVQLPPTLDVPYLPQTEALCGGAALAMVLRYWGARDVFAQDFAALVDARERGIRTSSLVSAARDRGWQAAVGSTAATAPGTGVLDHVARGRPVIALLEERANRYHYVVVIGSRDDAVIVHDPARAPFRVLSREEFDRRSAAADRWMLIVLPAAGAAPAGRTSPPANDGSVGVDPAPDAPCGDLVAHAVTLARAGDLASAERELNVARGRCPDQASPLVELAGIRFLQSRWSEARDFAERAVELAPGDRQARELVAGSRFLAGDLPGALEAWNHVGEPHADLIDIKGIARTRYPVVMSLLGIEPRQLMTPDAFRRAARRLDGLPAAAATSLRYEPQNDGTAKVIASAAERELVPRGLIPLGAMAVQAAITREVSVDVVSPTGNGEVWTGAWRWPSRRPRLALRLATPSPGWLPGVTTVDFAWERQTYGISPGEAGATFAAERRRAAVSVSDWITGRLRWHAGVGFDRFDAQPAASVSGGGEIRLAADRVALTASGTAWMPVNGDRRFQTAALSGRWTSRLDRSAPVLSAIAGVTFASRGAPLALWPGAGARTGRDVLLRGHLLLEDDVVTGEVFGRRLAYATVEYEHPLRESPFGRISAAVFADSARAWQRLGTASPSPFHVDVGGGVRLNAPGVGGRVRLDVGWGLRDRGMVLSAGWAGSR